MSDGRRVDVVARLVAAQDAAEREFAEVSALYEATDTERETARSVLRGALIDSLTKSGDLAEAPDMLAMDMHQVERLARQGEAVHVLLNALEGHWRSRPDLPLSTILASERRETVQWLARRLKTAGVHDLDDMID